MSIVRWLGASSVLFGVHVRSVESIDDQAERQGDKKESVGRAKEWRRAAI
jgi:hypothetical protein